jgi:hypothetical protein
LTAAWENHICILSGGGSVRCWGGSFSGQLGTAVQVGSCSQATPRKALRILTESTSFKVPEGVSARLNTKITREVRVERRRLPVID